MEGQARHLGFASLSRLRFCFSRPPRPSKGAADSERGTVCSIQRLVDGAAGRRNGNSANGTISTAGGGATSVPYGRTTRASEKRSPRGNPRYALATKRQDTVCRVCGINHEVNVSRDR